MAQTTAGTTDQQTYEQLARKAGAVREQVGKVIVGQDEVVEQLLTSLFAGGHCLMMGVPGLAKTLMVSTLARALDLGFKRIQFTPDLMPGDITGSEVIAEDEHGRKSFEFVPGPLFTNIILADEINRTPPKTQAALLEAMQEKSVSIGNKTHRLEEPFFVLATQNPIEQEGTYPLPEAQQDRFMFLLWLDYPKQEEEYQILEQTTGGGINEVEPVMSGEEIVRIHQLVREVPISRPLVEYAANIVRASRVAGDSPHKPETVNKYLEWGAGPRAGQFLILGAKARAFLNGASHVAAEDIRAMAYPVLRHRLVVNFTAEAEGIATSDVIRELLQTVPE